MSESDEHRELVRTTACALQEIDPNLNIITDLSVVPGNPVPPQIGGYRPDIIARNQALPVRLVICEAKTDADVDNRHTRDQIDAFLTHLLSMPNGDGTFVLAVSGRIADTARAVLRFNCQEHVSSRLRVALFDGLDFWILGPPGAQSWHLS